MESDQLTLTPLRKEIIKDTHELLRGLGIGSPLPDLLIILHRIRSNEDRLRVEEKAMLDPEMWKFLHTKLFELHGGPPEWDD